MTHHIHHQYDELIPASLPGLEVHVIYNCESEIAFNEYGDEESNRILSIAPTVNGQPATLPTFPRENGSSDERAFCGLLRESARQALWAKALRVAVAFPLHEQMMEAERWQRTGDLEQSLLKFEGKTSFVR